MGIFSSRKNNKSRKTTEFQQMTVEEALKKYDPSVETVHTKDVLTQAEDACKQILEIDQQFLESKSEYEAVTAYLSDIQRIEMISQDQRASINEAARKIIGLDKERLKFQNKKQSISEAQYHYLEQFEQDIPRELERMKAKEKFQILVKNDIKQLEGEKGICSYERESALDKIDFLKKLAIVACILVASVFILLIFLENNIQKEMTIPFFITGIMSIILVLYIILESKRSTYRLRISEKKLNKVVILENKVKIKFINSTNSLEYSYEKYRVNSYQEFQYQWKEFVKIKDETENFRKNSSLLEGYNEVLIHELRAKGVVDAKIWVFHPEALLDKKEMVEVRHRLNSRRQRLREQIDYNAKHREEMKDTLLSLMKSYPEDQNAMKDLMRSYHINC